MKDHYGNTLNTQSRDAVDHYVVGVDRVLGGEADMVSPMRAAVAADDQFALGYIGLARALVLSSDMAGAQAALAQAVELADKLPTQQAAHVACFQLLLSGKPVEALAAVSAHVADYPRDVMVAQLATSIYGLIGMSGLAGRESEMLAYTAGLLPHYGDNWWIQSQHAFSLCETGQLSAAGALIDQSLKKNHKSGHAAHIRSHVWYEQGNLVDGAAFLKDWLGGYDRKGMLHGHLSWHLALLALEKGDMAQMWDVVNDNVTPDVCLGMPLSVLVDTASVFYRAEIAGEVVPKERWIEISTYAAKFFPKSGNQFVDLHAALAHAMAGRGDLLEQYVSDAKGPAADLIAPCAKGFQALAKQDWANAAKHLVLAMTDTARLGGSRAQRDLLELALMNALLRQGKNDEAERFIALRRPLLASASLH